MKFIGFNIELSNIHKLFKKGKIGEVYNKIYIMAEKTAIHEMNTYRAELKAEFANTPEFKLLDTNPFQDKINNITKKVWKYKMKRLKYHYDEMKDLLKLYHKQEDSINNK